MVHLMSSTEMFFFVLFLTIYVKTLVTSVRYTSGLHKRVTVNQWELQKQTGLAVISTQQSLTQGNQAENHNQALSFKIRVFNIYIPKTLRPKTHCNKTSKANQKIFQNPQQKIFYCDQKTREPAARFARRQRTRYTRSEHITDLVNEALKL